MDGRKRKCDKSYNVYNLPSNENRAKKADLLIATIKMKTLSRVNSHVQYLDIF